MLAIEVVEHAGPFTVVSSFLLIICSSNSVSIDRDVLSFLSDLQGQATFMPGYFRTLFLGM
jgi:hypothetical protein